MKKNQEIKRTAAMVQETLNVPEDLDQRMAQVRERARQEFLAREAAQAAAPRPARKKKGLGYRLVTAMAIALALMVIPVAVTLISPVPVSSAGDFSRSVVIWLNDKLHLQLRVPETLEAPGGLSDMSAGEERVFHSLEEATAFVGHDLIALGNEEVKCELVEVRVRNLANSVKQITSRYLYENKEVVLVQKTMLTTTVLAPKYEANAIALEGREFYVWEINAKWRAMQITDNWNVQITTDGDRDHLVRMLRSMH